MTDPAQSPTVSEREAALRELICSFEQRSSSNTADLFQTASKDLGATKKLFYGGGSALVFILSTAGGWVMDAIEKMQKQTEVIELQSKKLEELDTKLKVVAERQNSLGRRAVANEVLIVDGIQWIADKVDAGKRSAREERPRSVSAAKRRIDDAGADPGHLFKLDSLAQH